MTGRPFAQSARVAAEMFQGLPLVSMPRKAVWISFGNSALSRTRWRRISVILSTAGMMKTGQAVVQKPHIVQAQMVSSEIQSPISSRRARPPSPRPDDSARIAGVAS